MNKPCKTTESHITPGEKCLNIAVAGATGLVGRKIIEILEERSFPVRELYLFASARSTGKTLFFRGERYTVEELTCDSIENKKTDIALFSAGAAVSEQFAPIFIDNGATVVDNSSRWRKKTNVPLIVPEVNASSITKNDRLIANPNCSTIQAAVALWPLHRAFGIKRIIYTTFQAVSGAGQIACEELQAGAEAVPNKFPQPIFSNVIPQIGDFDDDGYSEEENKMIFETRKILGDKKIEITATTVRVPVFFVHCISVNVEFHTGINIETAKELLREAPGVVYVDMDDITKYPTPLTVTGRDEVFVGRLRIDKSRKNCINMWIAADNIRKGAATNAVQIAEILAGLRKQTTF